MNEGNAKQQIVEGIKANSNILVTVSDSPSVDELSAALGLTILLNKVSKRATSIFSGAIPPAIQFLDPEKTFEGTVNSLRDFIIALDKEKADHLRYKVDGDVVKVFITPYRTTLSEKDLEFTQGDYNVEMVIALGVKDQSHLDKALEAHGKIFHDALVATISAGTTQSAMGSVNWHDPEASSLCEMLVSLAEALKGDEPAIDDMIATAFLTGIVSATDRFSNDHTSSRVMTMAAQLMAAGANQQLIAAQLQDAHDISPSQPTADVSSAKSPVADADVRKKDNDTSSFRIDRSTKDVISDSATASTVAEEAIQNTTKQSIADTAAVSAATAAAADLAVPSQDMEQELSSQLASVAPPALSTDELQKELINTAVAEPPIVEPSAPITDEAMPGFEALDVPVAPSVSPGLPVPTVSGAIESRPGDSYVESSPASASFDTPVDNIITGADGTLDQYVDPFQTPLAPMPELHDSKDIMPLSPEASPAPMIDTQPPLPPLPPVDLPPLPPIPDLSDASLPPLPPPPPPPVFGSPLPASPMPDAMQSDALGTIFGDSTAVDQSTAEPPKPGQFRIPGQ
ncbi:MAG: hypothetical protein WAS27_04630 [Candidatus Saccharimonadales bacterium]